MQHNWLWPYAKNSLIISRVHIQYKGMYKRGNTNLFNADALDLYGQWPNPIVIISDGPYGLSSFPGDPPTPDTLDVWYRPHVEQWSRFATPQTTLWFWNSEVGWAKTHHLFEEYGWEYRCCHVWDKGIGHIAGNCNGKTIRKFPVTTEVCVQYTKTPYFRSQGTLLPVKDWLRAEWLRTGLPLSATNAACGVRNAATRKYFTQDHRWYFPPAEAFERFANYANRHGEPSGRPYFSENGIRSITAREWERMRAKFNFEQAITNVWRHSAVRGCERIKTRQRCAHMNQKPLRLLSICIRASSDPGDVVWEPFGGLCSASLAAVHNNRIAYATEINGDYFKMAVRRFESFYAKEQFAAEASGTSARQHLEAFRLI